MDLPQVKSMDTYSDLESDNDEGDELSYDFNLAAKHLQKLVGTREIDSKTLLTLYAFYKSATVGKCNTPRPSWYDFQGKQKWDAWNNIGEISQKDAKTHYIKLIKEIDQTWSPKSSSDSKLESWVNVSSMLNTDLVIQDSDKTIIDFVRDGDANRVENILKTNSSEINTIDEEGLGLIHWACDRGNSEILEILINHSANVNLQAKDGQTGLHYAASCGHYKCVEILLRNKADINIKDEDGLTPNDISSDSNITNLITSYPM